MAPETSQYPALTATLTKRHSPFVILKTALNIRIVGIRHVYEPAGMLNAEGCVPSSNY